MFGSERSELDRPDSDEAIKMPKRFVLDRAYCDWQMMGVKKKWVNECLRANIMIQDQ